MSWLLRAMTACFAGLLAYFVLQGISRSLTATIYGWSVREVLVMTLFNALALLPFLLIAVAVFSWLTSKIEPGDMSRQTRCRNCGFILRKIREPRCPECGEWI